MSHLFSVRMIVCTISGEGATKDPNDCFDVFHAMPKQEMMLKTDARKITKCTPVCRLCGRYLAPLGRRIRVTVPAVTVAPTALLGSLIRSSNLPHSLQRGVLNV